MLARKREAAPAGRAKSSSGPESSGLRIGEPNDAFEREADRVADEIMAGSTTRLEWSLSRMSIATPLQRKCMCGGSPSLMEECSECREKNGTLQRGASHQKESDASVSLSRMQREFTTGTSNNPLELEAERIADQVWAPPTRFAVSGGVKRITGQTTRLADTTAPASVDRVLATPGSPLNPTLQLDMERRLDHDFSRVRVHSNDAAERSARDVDAQAYTVGHDIVFGEGRFVPWTHEGRRLIAHELTHVVQQEGMATSTPTVMRAGRTVGGFLANIFQFWNYSKETLDAYLKTLDRENQIQGDDDSDDMARQIVTEWKGDKSKYDLKPKVKILLVREMLDGVVSGADQKGIMDLLEGSTNSDLEVMFKTGPNRLGYEEIHDNFSSQKPHLELFEARVLKKLDRLKSPDPADAKSLENRLGDVEKQTGVAFQDLSVSFRLAAGTLYKSFLVDLKVPEFGVAVTITLTRSGLNVRIEPSILIDVIWPLSNAWLSGFKLTFAGLQSKLDIDGMDVVSAGAQKEVQNYLKGVLAGTRFEAPAYDPVKDPHLVSELLDPEVIGDVDRVKYNFEKNIKKDEGDSKLAEDVSGFGIRLNLVHKTGLPIPTAGWGVVIEPGTAFGIQIQTRGTASELMKKNLQLERLSIMSGGIFLYKGKDKIAMLTSIEMDRGLKIKLGGVKSFVDLKEVMRQESPEWLKGLTNAATELMKKYDDSVDWWNNFVTLGGLLGNRGPKSDVAKSIAVEAGETYLGWVVSGMLREHWHEIQGALGITDKQMESFFGLGSAREERP